MAVFRYKMQGILDIKEKLENKAKQEFAEANMRLDAEKKKLDELTKEREGNTEIDKKDRICVGTMFTGDGVAGFVSVPGGKTERL